MRSPFRRLSLATVLNKTYQARASPNTSLAQFLTTSKEKYLNDIRSSSKKGAEWTIVMGNEAGDLDTFASSIAYAWIQSEVHQKPTIPLIQMKRDDLDLRIENIYALGLAGLTEPKEQLLYLTDLVDVKPFPSHNFALVDHNRLGPSYDNLLTRVTAVIDHHKDEGLYHETANPRIIASSGSCASHIAALCPSEVPAEIATLLLTAILIDTNGLKPGGKAELIDVHAAGFLAPRSTYAPSLPPKLLASLLDEPKADAGKLCETPAIKDLTTELKTKKDDVSRLNGQDLLRRDYKGDTYTLSWANNQSIHIGLSSVPISLESWPTDGTLQEATISWMKDRGIAVLGVLTSFRSKKKNRKREMLWVVYDASEKPDDAPTANEGERIDFKRLSKLLWEGLEDSGEIKVKKHKKIDLEKHGKLPPGSASRAYNQGMVDANRKVIAPLSKRILENPESSPSKHEKKHKK